MDPGSGSQGWTQANPSGTAFFRLSVSVPLGILSLSFAPTEPLSTLSPHWPGQTIASKVIL